MPKTRQNGKIFLRELLSCDVHLHFSVGETPHFRVFGFWVLFTSVVCWINDYELAFSKIV